MQNKCYKNVGGASCNYCYGALIKHGLVNNRQRYRCKACKSTQMGLYGSNACNLFINIHITSFIKEGCGIRSIARLLQISASTVLRRIKHIADKIGRPLPLAGRIYEVDELRTYIKNKNRQCWVIYAIDRHTRQVVDFKVGNRTKINLQRVTDSLLLAKCKQIYTDGLNIYRYIVPDKIHKVNRYGTNRIERKNLSLRIHLKRLNRKTICFSKSVQLLEACLKIYFWHSETA